jgi:hypothetical protein
VYGILPEYLHSSYRSSRRAGNIIGMFIVLVVVVFFAWSFVRAYSALAQSPTGGMQYVKTANVIVSITFNRGGTTDVVSQEWDGFEWVDCDFCADALHEGNDKRERGMWWLRLPRHQTLVTAGYHYRGSGANAGKSKDNWSWNGRGVLYSTLRERFAGSNNKVRLRLANVVFDVYDNRLPLPPSGCDVMCPESGAMAGPGTK